MTVYRTVGLGGDYADWSAAWIWLCSIDPLGDDYEFEQISDCTINNSWPDTTAAANRLTIGNHYVKFYCPWANCHQGDPTKGYITYVNGNAGEMDINLYTGVLNQDRFIIENLYIRQTTASVVAILRLICNINGTGAACNFTANNLLIRGFSTGQATAIQCQHQNSLYNISNIKMWNIAIAINAAETASGGLNPLDNNVTNNRFENITVYNTSNLIGAIRGRSNIPASNVRSAEFRNVVSIDSATNRAWQYNMLVTANFLYNCAEDDGSISGTRFDCISNITPADEFQSFLDTESNFLKLNDGTYT